MKKVQGSREEEKSTAARRGEITRSGAGLGRDEVQYNEEDKMHTHQADVSERRLPPPRPELHSTAMSQGLPSVDTHTAKSSA